MTTWSCSWWTSRAISWKLGASVPAQPLSCKPAMSPAAAVQTRPLFRRKGLGLFNQRQVISHDQTASHRLHSGSGALQAGLSSWLPCLPCWALLTGSGRLRRVSQIRAHHHGAAPALPAPWAQSRSFHPRVREMFLPHHLGLGGGLRLPGAAISSSSPTSTLPDAYFETMSGVTTTGPPVLSGLDGTAHSILLWRPSCEWLGGVGFYRDGGGGVSTSTSAA